MATFGIIIQARMGSKRLPGKVLKKIGNKTMLGHLISRLGKIKYDTDNFVATSLRPIDDPIEDFCKKLKINCFRGDHENVLKRYYDCAKKNKLKQILRLTGDDPFFDAEEIDRLIDLHLCSNSDLTHSHPVLPFGVGAEIFTFEALEKSILTTKDPFHLEHVDEFILQNPGIFKISVLDVPVSKKRPDIRLTVDTEDDYKKACFIVEKASRQYITTQSAIELAMAYERRIKTQ